MSRRFWAWFVGLTAVTCSGASAAGQSGDCRSGNGGQPAWYARASDAGQYTGYPVGGGAPFRGEAPLSGEGVWGWDYEGWHFRPRIALLWGHGRKYQGGAGAYQTDGPRFLQECKEKKGE
jgi:hypothetical protein